MFKPHIKKSLVLTAILATLGSVGITQARTDDARVLGGLDRSVNIYTYLNTYPYKLLSSNPSGFHHDTYISKDNCIIIDVYANGLGRIYIIGPGYSTNKGIKLGMTLTDIENAYGPIYSNGKKPNDYTATYGTYESVASYGDSEFYKDFTGYAHVEYVSPTNEGLSFILNRHTGKIVMIVYTPSRHGNYNGLQAAISSHRLAKLK